ncbi:hypothetical protein [Ruminococcus sp.]|uniref:hypothetical protein n=1 Tax=Ruminococcus sp. TaxID=41978 RepID=UPI001B713439|nr:hypothetical protein [Ruminococcus sp.]MBP5431021.1 hypothetical protein [Ruminococcus sp.]
MNKYDVAGIMKTYSEKAVKAESTEQLRQIVRDLKKELDLRQIAMEGEKRK